MSTSNDVSLYQKRIPIFTRSVKGKFRRFKSSVLLLAYAVFFILPWLPWDRGDGSPSQAILFDIPGRMFYIFSLPVHIQNIMWLAAVLAIFAFSLFFVTAVLGRVFCGYFCFQTLWTDAFIMIESLVQGSRNARKKLYESPWNGTKVAKVGLTWLLWFVFAFWSGFSFTAYWGYAPELFVSFFTGQAPFAAYATTALLTATTFIMAGFAREQVCTFMCPYARFQGVMFDKDTLTVTYDEARGEREKGRAKPVRNLRQYEDRKAAGYGDCVDCELCVQVCPAGIDIRNGIDYRCITCGLCIDACHNMMTSAGYPTGLIRYESASGLEGKKTNYFSPRNVGYATVIILITAGLIWSIANRATSNLVIEPIRAKPVTLSSGGIQNRYEVKYNNLGLEKHILEVALKDEDNYELKMRHNNIVIDATKTVDLRAYVIQKPESKVSGPITFIVTIRDKETGDILETKELEAAFGL